MKKTLLIAAVLLLTASLAHALLGTTAPTGQLSLTVGPEAGLTVVTGTTTLTSAGLNLSPYTGTTNLTYFVRTTRVGGSGSVVLRVTTDFAGAGGPSVGTPPTAGDALKYTCTVSAPGTACSGTQTSSTAATTPVATFGTDAHSAVAGNSASVAWALTNDPLYATGSYTATVTYTIAAL